MLKVCQRNENIRDWTISRQLWWGHRIPAYYLGEEEGGEVFIAESKEEALKQAIVSEIYTKADMTALKESLA